MARLWRLLRIPRIRLTPGGEPILTTVTLLPIQLHDGQYLTKS